MQRLTYPRSIIVPVVPKSHEAIVDFYATPPRSWTREQDSPSVFKLKFFRGNWGESRLSRWLPKTSLAKFLAKRRPLAPTRDGATISFNSWPAELSITITHADGMLELSLVYEVTMCSGENMMSRDDKIKWKTAVEEDANELLQRLQKLHRRT